jgi:hypothetical protein
VSGPFRADLPDLDTRTALLLGEALYRFLLRANAESDLDEFAWEDAGVSISGGFVEIDPDAAATVQLLAEQHEQDKETSGG